MGITVCCCLIASPKSRTTRPGNTAIARAIEFHSRQAPRTWRTTRHGRKTSPTPPKPLTTTCAALLRGTGRAQVQRYELAPHRQRAAFFESLGAHLSRHIRGLTAEDALPAADASDVEPSTCTLLAGLHAQCDDEFNADLLPQSTRRTRPSSTSAILGAISLPELHGGKEPVLAAKFAARAAEELAKTAAEWKRAREAAAQTQAVAGAEALRRSDPVEAARREKRDALHAARMAELKAEYDDDAFE
ncbi:hypothetical protein T492DRAFT_839078 [Pavlovales sp. CCMP2436]|nr:hypothetical protein T492DRAFT_839078 [Pavlovales sp. CCMP2436]